MATLARLRALPDLDLEVVRRVREQRGHAEPAGGDLLAAPLRVLAEQVRKLPALAVDAEDVEAHRGFRVRAVRGLALGAERHGRDVEGRAVLAGDRGRFVQRPSGG